MIQKILQLILPEKLFQKIKNESKKWFMVCNKCGYSKSYWDAGGIRAGAASCKKVIFGHCPNCKKWKFFNVIKKV
jgi:protein-arginine kinase activator protein McsA